jgi:hypothetical protein
MTLGNMRANGVRSLSVNCWLCHHGAVLAADRWPDDVHRACLRPPHGVHRLRDRRRRRAAGIGRSGKRGGA